MVGAIITIGIAVFGFLGLLACAILGEDPKKKH